MARAGLDTAAVVRAAAAIADRDGLGAVTLSSVAASLGVKPPSLYTHIRGLGDLRRRLAALAAADLVDALTPAVAGRAGGDALRAAGRAHRRWALAHPGMHDAIQSLPAQEPAGRRLVELMVAAINGYGLEGAAAVHAVRGIRAAIHGFVALETGGGFGLPLDPSESFERLLDVLDRGLPPLTGPRSAAEAD